MLVLSQLTAIQLDNLGRDLQGRHLTRDSRHDGRITHTMQFMGPIFGTPESHLAQLAGCQLVRRLGVPCRGDGLVTSSKINDAQAGYEGASALGASLAGGADRSA